MRLAKRTFNVISAVLLLSTLSMSCGEWPRDYLISGMVTDSNFNPLAGVDVFFYSIKSATTASDGTYSFTTGKMFNVVGQVLTFTKAGYTTVVAPPFTIAEAGADFGGQVNLKRDAVLVLQ